MGGGDVWKYLECLWQSEHLHTRIWACTHTDTRTYKHLHTSTNICTHTLTEPHTHTHTHTHTEERKTLVLRERFVSSNCYNVFIRIKCQMFRIFIKYNVGWLNVIPYICNLMSLLQIRQFELLSLFCLSLSLSLSLSACLFIYFSIYNTYIYIYIYIYISLLLSIHVCIYPYRYTLYYRAVVYICCKVLVYNQNFAWCTSFWNTICDK